MPEFYSALIFNFFLREIMRNFVFFVSVFILCFTGLKAQEKVELTGNLQADAKYFALTNAYHEEKGKIDFSAPDKKSPFLAGALSFVLPGAGQFYNQSYWKTAVFGAIEVTAIVIGLKYDKKGDDQTDFFEAFANEHWSVKRYAEWTIKNVKNINSSVDPSKFKVFNQDGSVNWQELNGLERELGSGYSHALPVFGDQQYYELIGKYPQYSHGWDDSNQDETDFHFLSPNFSYYSTERGKANDYYNVAAKAVVALYINHLVSIVDAAWEAARINNKLKAHVSYEREMIPGVVEYSPKLTLSYSF